MTVDGLLQRLWYGPAWLSVPLWPLALLHRLVVTLRAASFRFGLLRTLDAGVPVVVVGNITVGGTGKTPVAAWLVRQLELRGRRVGVVLRGYGGSHRGDPRIVELSDSPAIVGDEALLHARRRTAIVVIGSDRVAAARLAARQGAEVVVSDDGLQHLRLARDYEVAVLDAARGVGNGLLLPAGPLREPVARLERVQALVTTRRGGHGEGACETRVTGPLRIEMRFEPGAAVNLVTGTKRPLTDFAVAPGLHAVAGVGHPQAFFGMLEASGIRAETHALADHASLVPGHLPFPADATVLMTEKDAVKCREFARPGWWWIELEPRVDRTDAEALLASILERTGLTGAGVTLG